MAITPGKIPREKLPPNVIWLGITSMLNDVSSEIITRGLPLFLAGTLGVSKGLIGLIEGIAATVASLLQVFSGWFSDRWGSRKAITGAGYGISAISRPLLLFASTWVLPFAVKVLDRVGKGIRTSPRDALIADSVPVEIRGRAFGYNRALDPAGAVIGALIGAWLLYSWSGITMSVISVEHWKTLVIVATIPGMLAAGIVFIVIREARREQRVPPPISKLLHVGRDPRFRRLLIVVLLFSLGLSSDAFLLLRAQSVGISMAGIFLILALFNVVTALSAYPAGILSDRLSRRTLIRAGWIAYAVIYFAFAFATEAWQIWVLFIVYGVYYGLTEGVEKAFVADLVLPEERGAAFGIYNAAVGIMALPASLMAGLLWQSLGPAAPFLFGGAVALIATLLLRTIPEGTRTA